ncbi:signal peptidase II [Candidatus Atribacteria bacterium MT.SAG.1]|nr:signal peptidase II [Candidatus Atribacteria bacterium MT.SAG.1]TFB07948.1 signal peptidase II [Candidatus Atribacteria bacterium MT.SAG.1]
MGFIGFAIFIVLFDQASKFYIQHNMDIGESIPIIKGIFHITYIENSHTAFGLFKYQTTFFVIAVLISVILAILIYKRVIFKKDSFMYIPLTLVLGGAVGNLIDRARIDGRVIDFIDFRIWPIFNFADTAIICGTLILLVHFLFYTKQKQNKEKV